MNFKVHKYDHHFKPNLTKYFWSIKDKKLSADVIFDASCKYSLDYPEVLQVNKLFGIANIHHHFCSGRFGWNYRKGKINLFAYCYSKFKRQYEDGINVLDDKNIYLTSCNLGEKINLSIVCTKGYFKFNINGLEYYNSPINIPFVGGYKLMSPYFGGKHPSPKDMNIEIIYT